MQLSSSYTTYASLLSEIIRQKVQDLSIGGYEVGRSCTDRRMKEVIVYRKSRVKLRANWATEISGCLKEEAVSTCILVL
jgi:hypothetical protein